MIKKIYLLALTIIASISSALAQINHKQFTFEFDGVELHGYIDKSHSNDVKGTIILIPGHGKTNAANYDLPLRNRLVDVGYNCIIYDRQGCGKSEGEYDHNQSIESSSEEVISALISIKNENRISLSNLGIWSHSRGGWIAPVVINKFQHIDFWISLSGPDQLETFPYMIERNLIIEGKSPAYASAIAEEWNNFMLMLRDTTATYEEFIKVTPNLFNELFYRDLEGDRPSEADFQNAQAALSELDEKFDPKTRLKVMVPQFSEVMKNIDCPVLAIFGDKDTQINWQRSKNFYHETIGENSDASLDIVVLPDCNHSMIKVKTGAWGEDLSDPALGGRCPKYFTTVIKWLNENN